jgi:UDP-2-acetamido-3-amino-2,3-dideoxy-glucuronate N-acetyltransferase
VKKNYNFEEVFIHESSYVDQNVKIGEGTKIWHFSHILKNSKIGRDCTVGQNVCIGPNVIIGKEVKIQNNVSIYDGVTLEDNVFCGPSCVFTNDKYPRSRLKNSKETWLKTQVKRGATLGANCTIVCGVTIGSFSLVAAGTVILKNIPDYALMAGVPGKQIGWVSEYGEKLDLPLIGNAQALCKYTNQKYQLKDDKVNRVT